MLHLINKYEIDIYDIPVAEITKQYTEFIQQMQEIELNVASEYLVMAATLAAIKSQMLLPKQEVDEDIDEYMEDPREELVARLINYRKFKAIAEELKEKEINSEQIFMRSPEIMEDLKENTQVQKGSISVYDMLSALNNMLERKAWNEPQETHITRVEIPIEERMEQIRKIVFEKRDGTSFEKLFIYHSRSHIVITFMALLELMKDNVVICEQRAQLDAIYIFPRNINK